MCGGVSFIRIFNRLGELDIPILIKMIHSVLPSSLSPSLLSLPLFLSLSSPWLCTLSGLQRLIQLLLGKCVWHVDSGVCVCVCLSIGPCV